MKKILPLIMLISCRSEVPRVHNTTQCTQHLEFVSESEIDLAKSFCACREYEYGLDRIGPKTNYEKVEFAKCDGLVGHRPKKYTDVINYFEQVRLMIKDQMENPE